MQRDRGMRLKMRMGKRIGEYHVIVLKGLEDDVPFVTALCVFEVPQKPVFDEMILSRSQTSFR
jgi:hypothetical protein